MGNKPCPPHFPERTAPLPRLWGTQVTGAREGRAGPAHGPLGPLCMDQPPGLTPSLRHISGAMRTRGALASWRPRAREEGRGAARPAGSLCVGNSVMCVRGSRRENSHVNTGERRTGADISNVHGGKRRRSWLWKTRLPSARPCELRGRHSQGLRPPAEGPRGKLGPQWHPEVLPLLSSR